MLSKIQLKLNIVVIVTAGLLAPIASGCSFNPQTEILSNLESICPPPKNAIEDFRIVGSRDWSRGKVALYEATCRSKDPAQPSMRYFGHHIFVRSLIGWQYSGGGSSGTSLNAPQSSPKEFVDYSSGSGGDGSNRRAVISGRILNSQVTAVEAIFNNGRIMRDSGADDVFAMVSSGASAVCELRVLGANDKVLQKYKPESLNGDIADCK